MHTHGSAPPISTCSLLPAPQVSLRTAARGLRGRGLVRCPHLAPEALSHPWLCLSLSGPQASHPHSGQPSQVDRSEAGDSCRPAGHSSGSHQAPSLLCPKEEPRETVPCLGSSPREARPAASFGGSRPLGSCLLKLTWREPGRRPHTLLGRQRLWTEGGPRELSSGTPWASVCSELQWGHLPPTGVQWGHPRLQVGQVPDSRLRAPSGQGHRYSATQSRGPR